MTGVLKGDRAYTREAVRIKLVGQAWKRKTFDLEERSI